MKRARQTTTTTLVTEALRRVDDFLNAHQLTLCTGRTRSQVGAALFHLRKHRVIDVVVEPDGTGWWYALPESDDDRLRVHEETAVGVTKRPHRRKRVIAVQ